MAFPSKWVLRLSGLGLARERVLAEASRGREQQLLQQDADHDAARYRAHARRVGRDVHVVLGTSPDGVPYRIPLGDLTGLPSWVTAATGAGKSRFVGAFMDAVLRHALGGAPVALVLVDGKGETADLMLRSIASCSPGAVDLARVHTFRFFDREFLPSWPLLHRVPGVPVDAQADAVAEVLTDVAQDALIGPRQRSTLAAVLAVAIEFDVPLSSLPWLLSGPSEITALASRSTLPSVRLELSRFEREPQGSIDGLVARLGTLLRVPSLKAALSGPRPFDFSACFHPGSVTVLDFGGADLGARAGVRAMGSLAITALANAAFDPRHRARCNTMIVVDEPSALMTSVTVRQFERLVTLGRSFGAGGLVVVHQGATQLPNELQSVLNTNVPLRVMGRTSERDSLASSEWLPRTGTVPRRREPGARSAGGSTFMSDGEEQRLHVAELGRLAPRHFLVADRRVNFAPRVIRAPDYEPPPWSDLDPDVAEAVRRGSAGFPRAALEARVREIEDEAARRFDAGQRPGVEGAARRRRAAPTTPDVLGASRGRSRGREVP